jgi:hypothetical protein
MTFRLHPTILVVTQSKRRAKTLEISTLRKFRMQIQRVFKQNAPVAAVRRSGNSREFDVMFALAARGHILYISCKQASTQQQHLGSNCVYTLCCCDAIAAADYTKSVMQRERRRAINHGRKIRVSLSFFLCFSVDAVCEIISRSAIQRQHTAIISSPFAACAHIQQASQTMAAAAQNTRAPLSALCMR